MRTQFANPRTIERSWFLLDATDVPLGRLAARAAALARGKHRAYFTPNADVGDRVIVINAAKVAITGRKRADKIYYRHSGYPGGLKQETFAHVLARKPTFPVEHAIKGMLPKGSLGRQLYRKVRVYPGSTHPHAGQSPQHVVFD